MLVFVLAYVFAIYGWAFIINEQARILNAASEWWSTVRIGPGALILWALSIALWLLFAIGGWLQVRGEDDARTTDRWGR